MTQQSEKRHWDLAIICLIVVFAASLLLNLGIVWAILPWPQPLDLPQTSKWLIWSLIAFGGIGWIGYRIKQKQDWAVTDCWIIFGIASLLWWTAAGQFHIQNVTALIGTSFASFLLGCLIGFIFTSYDEERDSIGKVRDWLVASLTTATLLELATGAQTFHRVINILIPNNLESDRHLHVAALAIYAVCGFLMMFYTRETIWNPLLAEGRQRRRRIEQRVAQAVSLSDLEPGDKLDDIQESDLPKETQNAIGEILLVPLRDLVESVESLKARSKAEYLRRDYASSIRTMKLGITRYCNDPDLLFYLAHFLTAADRPLEAIPYLEQLAAHLTGPHREARRDV